MEVNVTCDDAGIQFSLDCPMKTDALQILRQNLGLHD